MKKKLPYENDNKGFKVPENYFDTVENTFFENIKNINSQKDLSLGTRKTPGYTTPESYFDGLEERILDKVAPSTDTPKVLSLFSWKKITYATVTIAALFVLIISIYKEKDSLETDTFALIDTVHVQNYIEEGELELSIFDVEDILLDQNIDISALNSDNVREESLYQYLEDHIETEYILTE